MMDALPGSAVIIYGALAIILAFGFSAIEGSTFGMVLVVAAAGATYVYQLAEYVLDAGGFPPQKWLDIFALAPPLLVIASVISALLGV